MPVIADIPTTDPHSLGVWLLGLFTVLLIGERVLAGLATWRKLREPEPESRRAVTHADLTEIRRLLGTAATKGELADLKGTVEKLDGYVHAQNHELRDALNTLTTRMASMTTMMESYQRQADRVLTTVDAATKELTRVSALVEIKLKTEPMEVAKP